jgi:hypothetical protein
LCGDSVESRARREKSLRKAPVVVCMTERKCFVKRRLESSTRPQLVNR